MGSLFFSVQLILILWICPEKTGIQSWLNLASHWDSAWYASIAKMGYLKNQGAMRIGLDSTNVAFFPGYPYFARAIRLLSGVDVKVALLLVSQGAALLFWCFLFHVLRDIAWQKQLYAAILIVSFPTSWFLFMGYSESLFILAACLMLWCVTQRRWVLAGLSGLVMTGTRILGVPVLIAPLLANIWVHFPGVKAFFCLKQIRSDLKTNAPFLGVVLAGSLGCLAFLIYCAVYLGSWHLYFDVERIYWAGTADPLFLFKVPTWMPPPLGYALDWAGPLPNAYGSLFIFKFFQLAAYSFSEALVPFFLWFFIFYSINLWRKNNLLDHKILTWYFAALLLFLFSCFSLSTRYYESMSRCLYPVWILFVVSDVLQPKQYSLFTKITMPIVILISSAFWLQLLNRYFLGWWVA